MEFSCRATGSLRSGTRATTSLQWQVLLFFQETTLKLFFLHANVQQTSFYEGPWCDQYSHLVLTVLHIADTVLFNGGRRHMCQSKCIAVQWMSSLDPAYKLEPGLEHSACMGCRPRNERYIVDQSGHRKPVLGGLCNLLRLGLLGGAVSVVMTSLLKTIPALDAGSENFSSLVVMTKGTKWTQQSYKVDSTFPYEWIKKKWRENFHVTSIGTAGSPSTKQQWAIVMSRDTDFRHQVVEIDFQYPSEGIHYHWDKGALPCCACCCFVPGPLLNSNGQPKCSLAQNCECPAVSGFKRVFVVQCLCGRISCIAPRRPRVPLMTSDTHHFSGRLLQQLTAHAVYILVLEATVPEQLYLRMAGYRITACGATQHQAAVVMSLPKRAAGEPTQETLRTGEFPAAYVKEKWERDLYIDLVAYGRTVS